MSTCILVGDVLDGLFTLADASIDMCVTSPPYWGIARLRYGRLARRRPDV
jgi:DNA modification methylase